jgi:hypothetical protein
MTDQQPDAREVPVWRQGDGPISTRTWTRGAPAIEVHVGGQWCPATLAQREDRHDGLVVYHVNVLLPGETSRCSRTYAWDPATIRPVNPPTADPIETRWDAQGRVIRSTRPGQ